MAKVVRGDGTRFSVADVKSKTESSKIIVQNNKRFFPNAVQTPTYLRPPRSGIAKQVELWLQGNNHDHYMGFGGLGDALLTLAACWNNPKAKCLFFGNGGSIPIIAEFFKLFEIAHMVVGNIMGQPIALGIQQMVQNHINFKTSGHLADCCDYGDWLNDDKYKERMVVDVPWIDKLGKENNLYQTKGVIVLGPHGSARDFGRQRFLTREEHHRLVSRFSVDHTVYSIGSKSDFDFYGTPKHQNALWVTSEHIIDHKGVRRNISLEKMLRLINSASHVYSMDTWLKTYTSLIGLPTSVIETRFSGKYRGFGADITDWIFLNSKIWPKMKFIKIENLIL